MYLKKGDHLWINDSNIPATPAENSTAPKLCMYVGMPMYNPLELDISNGPTIIKIIPIRRTDLVFLHMPIVMNPMIIAKTRVTGMFAVYAVINAAGISAIFQCEVMIAFNGAS